MERTEILRFRVSPREKEKIERNAAYFPSVSDFVRCKALEAGEGTFPPPPPPPPQPIPSMHPGFEALVKTYEAQGKSWEKARDLAKRRLSM